MHKITTYLSIFLIATAYFAFSQNDKQVAFTAKVSKTSLGINERLRVDFQMNRDGDHFSPPSFQNFRVLMGPNQSISNSWVNGKRSFSKTYTYILMPTKKGRLKINQATVEIEGNIYKTTPIEIVVNNAIATPKDPDDPNYIVDQNIHLVAEISKGNPYLNESITLVYKLYYPTNVIYRNLAPIELPQYDGFWYQEIENNDVEIKTETYKGQNYRAITLSKRVLYPQKTGKLSLEPLVIDVSLQIPTKRRDFFGGRIYTLVQKTVTAGKRNINVKPLPEAGKPIDFTGAVGDFTFSLKTNKNSLKVGKSLQATVEVRGRGNLKLFDLPKLKVPNSLEVYEPEHNSKVKAYLYGMQGTVNDNYTIVPQYKGKYPIPPLKFSYFDPKAKAYKTITSKEVLITVSEGPLNTAASTPSAVQKQSVVKPSTQFNFIKLNSRLKDIKTVRFFGTKAYFAVLLLPLLLIPIAVFVRKKKAHRNSDIQGNKLRRASRLAKRFLSEAKKNLGKKEPFYESMERALHNFLRAKLSIETAEMSKAKIKTLLEKKSVSEQSIKEFISILENCELARYTPTTGQLMKNEYHKAVKIISSIDKQIR